MRYRLLPAGAVALAMALAGCSFKDPLESFGGPTMGSTYNVKYVRGDGAPSVAEAQREVEAILAEVDAQMSTYRNDSFIEQFNDAPAGCREAPAPVRELVTYGEQLSSESDGAFDLTVEPLLNLWGFGPRGHGEKVPSAEQLQAVRGEFGHAHLRVDGERLCKDIDALQVDFNAIAAGYAVDRISARLQAMGVKSYLVEATGELKAVGHKPDGSPWRVAIEAPLSEARSAQRIVELDGYGVSTSGDYRNYFEENGVRYSHTLDPRAGAPIRHHLAAVTVVDPSTLHADGLSTLFMVLGPQAGYDYAAAHDIAALFVSREGEGFASRSTPAFDALFPARGE